ncbi:hypothetical protein QVD17_24193 [Tagetes erecta]|uniref:Pentatricopeptide repeat-containing protein n=1 Tax=Tagetes erecta TaxID=13708 RepID=A0AAD8KFD8_TARER|nr:hypothetical protein QVD17_24193 [Tagetes erecta]
MAKISFIIFSNLKSCKLHHHISPLTIPLLPNQSSFSRLFSQLPKRNTKVNFSLSDSDDESTPTPALNEIDNSKLPPPYNPFNKTPTITQPNDPTNLQEVFHNLRTEGLNNSAVKMFDEMSKHGLTHEALELFSQFKDKGYMPDVVAHTAVIEAYASAGKAKEALKVYMRMLASGVLPNAYTYTVLVKSLAGSGDRKLLVEAKKYLLEMVRKKIRPNAGTCLAVFEGLVKEGMEEECRELVVKMKGLGFDPDEVGLRELVKTKKGQIFRLVMNILFPN